jgi:hypothetical protein
MVRKLSLSICLCLASLVGSAQAETLYYGSRVGMEVTVVKKTGIDTTRAKITVEHTRENAIAFCRDYVGEVTEDCIKEELALELNSEIAANCKTGKFTTLHSRAVISLGYQFLGPNPDYDPTGYSNTPEFLIVDLETNEPLGDSMASGYYTVLGQFAAMCPSRVK